MTIGRLPQEQETEMAERKTDQERAVEARQRAQDAATRASDLDADQPEQDRQAAARDQEHAAAIEDREDARRHRQAVRQVERAVPDGAGQASGNPGARTQEEAERDRGLAPARGADAGRGERDEEPATLEPEGKGKRWAAEVHYPADVLGLPAQDEYVKQQLKELGHSGGKVVAEEDHPDGGRRLRVEG